MTAMLNPQGGKAQVQTKFELSAINFESGLPRGGITAIIVRDDGTEIELTTDSTRSVVVDSDSHPGFVLPNHHYTIRAFPSHQVGTQSELSTFGITKDTTLSCVLPVSDIYTFPLDIFVSDEETGAPVQGARIVVRRSDDSTLTAHTNAQGHVKISPEEFHGFVIDEFDFILTVDGVPKMYTGSSDLFTTRGINLSSRYIRELKVRSIKRCCGPPEILFPDQSSRLDSIGLVEIRNVYDMLTENPTVTVEIAGIYDNNLETTLAQRRADIVYQKLIEFGIAGDRLVVRTWARPINSTTYDAFPENCPDPTDADVMFTILSFNYAP